MTPVKDAVVVRGPQGCWFLDGKHVRPDGYVCVDRDGTKAFAHRWSYEKHVGPIPAGHDLDHLCHTADTSCPGGRTCPHRACIRPDHLEPVPSRVNTLRGRGVAAKHAATTHCPAGHPYDTANTLLHRDGKRRCRTCVRSREAARKRALRAQNRSTP